MGKGNNQKYSRKDLEKLISGMGFKPDTNNGKHLGKGDHVVWVHERYQDIKLVIPKHRELCENEMSDICANIIIVMSILGMDTSIFTHKEGIEGKLMKTAKNAQKDICILFSKTTKNCLGINEREDILEYVRNAQEKVKSNTLKKR